jgi:hypothetical protein
MNKEFFKEIDKVVQSSWEELQQLAKSIKTQIMSIEFVVELDDIQKYGLNKDILLVVNTYDKKMKYYYKNLEIEPECYYNRPQKYYEVSTLDILQECIMQDSHTPNIKAMENGTCKRIQRKQKLERICGNIK